MLTPIEAVRLAILRYNDFDGRSRRSEFWWVQLALLIGTVFVGMIDMAMGFDLETVSITPALAIFILITILPVAAVTARRLHDVGLTGWAQLPLFATYISYIPGFEKFLVEPGSGKEYLLAILFVIYGLWMLFNLIKDGQPERNIYGANPKTADVSKTFD